MIFWNTDLKPIKMILVICLFGPGCFSCGDPLPQAGHTRVAGTPVQIVHPKHADITEFIDLNANTVFLNKEIVRATFQGFIENIYKNIGDEVKAGETLLLIKTKESAADDSLRLNLGNETFRGFVKLRARSDGVLTALNYHSGDFISDGEEIAIISNPSSLRISLNVPYQYAGKIRRNERCSVFLPDGRKLTAAIQTIIPSIDPSSQTQTFLLKIDNRVNLPENLNVNARIPLRTVKEALAVPRSAIMSNETLDQFWIMKLLNDTIALRLNIRKGIENDSLVQVAGPKLDISDRIISGGAFGLPDTAKITFSK